MDRTRVVPETNLLTTCPFCGCGCGLYLQQQNGRLNGVVPSEGHPVSRGRLCHRGWAAHEPALWGERIRQPLVRRDGVLQPVSWEEALDHAAASLSRLRDQRKPLGVLGSGRATNEENFLAAMLARAALRTGHLDAPGGRVWRTLAAAGAAEGLSPGAVDLVESAELILVVEGNLAVTHPRLASAALRAVRRGARLVTIGWAPTRMTELAAKHLRLPARAPLSVFDELAAVAAAARSGSPEGATVPADSPLAQVLLWLAGSRHTVILLGDLDADPVLLEGMADALHSFAGAVQGAGGGAPVILPLATRANTRGAFEMGVAPDRLPGAWPVDDVPARDRMRAVWGGEPCWEAGLAAPALWSAVNGLVVVNAAVLVHATSPSSTLAALAALDCLVVIDAYLTPTARNAHVVLPATTFGETEGSVTALDGRVQPVRALAAPPGDARPGWWILAELAARLGATFRPVALDDVRAAIDRAVGGADGLNPSRYAGRDNGVARWTAPAPPAPAGNGARAAPAASGPLLLRLDGAFDWATDPMVTASPTLRRKHASCRKLHPRGMVAVSPEDAAAWGVREGAPVRLRSARGEAEVAITVRPGQEAGVLFVPFVFRNELSSVLDSSGTTAVEVVRI